MTIILDPGTDTCSYDATSRVWRTTACLWKTSSQGWLSSSNTWQSRANQAWGPTRSWSSGTSWESMYNSELSLYNSEVAAYNDMVIQRDARTVLHATGTTVDRAVSQNVDQVFNLNVSTNSLGIGGSGSTTLTMPARAGRYVFQNFSSADSEVGVGHWEPFIVVNGIQVWRVQWTNERGGDAYNWYYVGDYGGSMSVQFGIHNGTGGQHNAGNGTWEIYYIPVVA